METMTIKKPSTSAVARKLYSLGFPKYENHTEVGVKVETDNWSVLVTNYSYTEGTAAQELEAAGYIIEERVAYKSIFTQFWTECFYIAGKVAN